MRKRTKILLIIFVIIASLTAFGIYMINKINQEMEVLTISEIPEINLVQIDDGTYSGSFKSLLIKVQVEVTIQNHVITDIIILEHQNGQGDDADVIIDDVLLEQSINIDFISGATYSSKAILLAIGDALTN
ncbi:MAG: FMN-binding protein [Acholeplasmataceae bacterium]|jgi:uncharacterized protein with FMN-binding domain|nr:FMN-binding protein [Acholeplasmataceae bacterium]MDD4194079.1 FMN-binding protein [Acholeplasmataceae bacterium]MDY0339333.1 FMN-binding protein [Acholeplasmataceae bacterium]